MKPLIAKLTRPRLANVVERKRLFEHLDRIGENKAVWISAPAGSGKTTLVANWLDSRKLRCIWYQADEGDADIATFFSYMDRAIRHAAPRYRTPLPLLTPEYRPDIPTFTKRYFETLYSRLRPPCCLVIDNYQDVPAESQFHEVIRDGLSIVPDGVAIVIASRSDPPPVFSRLQANGLLEVLRKDVIGFTLDESRELVASRGKKKQDDDVLKALYRMTEGWAAGLVLLTESAVTRDDLPNLWEIPPDRIFDYFATELFSGADEEIRQFLMTTSFMPTMTIRAAEDLSGNIRTEQFLSRLSRANFFTERLTTAVLSYKYHPLFREFLQLRAKESFQQDSLSGIKRKAALLLLKEGHVEDAAGLLIEVGDWRGLTELILASAAAFMAAGRFLTVGSWIHRIPDDIVEHTGWLLYWKASCRLATRPAQARAMLEKAYALFQAGNDAAGSYLSWSGIVDTFLYEWRDFRPLDRWIDEYERISGRLSGYLSTEVEERATSSLFAAMMFRQPQHSDLLRLTQRVKDIMMSADDPSRRMFIGQNLILYYLWTGRINEAGSLVSMLSPVVDLAESTPLSRLMWLRSEALYLVYVSQSAAGLRAVEQGLQLAEETGVHHLDLMFNGVAVYHAVFRGDRKLAKKYLDRMTTLLDQGACYAAIYYAAQSALVALLEGDINSAIQRVNDCVRLTEEAGAPLILNAHLAQRLCIYVEGKHYEGVNELISSLRQRLALIKGEHIEAWCAIFEAQLALSSADQARFRERFGRAVALCRKTGLRFLAFLPETLVRMFSKALEFGIEKDFVKDQITANQLVPEHPETVTDVWPWPVKIRTLGSFEVFVDDKPVTFSGRVQQKPLAMLKAIIAFGGKDVGEDQITDALWPDSDGDVVHKSFNTTLHRLRKLINNDNAIVLREGRVSLDERYCWVDTRAFEQALYRAEEAWRKEKRGGNDDESHAAGLTEKAISIYRGHFLPGDTKEPWTISRRERLRSKFMYSINTLGLHWTEAGRYDKAVQVFLNGLEIDDLAEEFYQHLMVCHNQLGQQAEAVKAYHRCRSVLNSSLGLKPSGKTEGIYSMIRNGFMLLFSTFLIPYTPFLDIFS